MCDVCAIPNSSDAKTALMALALFSSMWTLGLARHQFSAQTYQTSTVLQHSSSHAPVSPPGTSTRSHLRMGGRAFVRLIPSQPEQNPRSRTKRYYLPCCSTVCSCKLSISAGNQSPRTWLSAWRSGGLPASRKFYYWSEGSGVELTIQTYLREEKNEAAAPMESFPLVFITLARRTLFYRAPSGSDPGQSLSTRLGRQAPAQASWVGRTPAALDLTDICQFLKTVCSRPEDHSAFWRGNRFPEFFISIRSSFAQTGASHATAPLLETNVDCRIATFSIVFDFSSQLSYYLMAPSQASVSH